MSIEQIEENIRQLSLTDQLRLIERLVYHIRERTHPELEEELATMANDRDIQRELRLIESEFAGM